MDAQRELKGILDRYPKTVRKLTVKKVGPKYYIYADAGRHPTVIGRYDSLRRAREAVQAVSLARKKENKDS